MGLYWKAVCDELRESIDPGDVNDGGIKIGSLVDRDGDFGRLVMATLAGRWSGRSCRLVADESEDPAYDAYRDVTEEVIRDFNSDYRGHGPIKYTGTPWTPTPPAKETP